MQLSQMVSFSGRLHSLAFQNNGGFSSNFSNEETAPVASGISAPKASFTVETHEPKHASMRNFYIIAGGYMAFTVTDSALRMIVLFELYQRSYQVKLGSSILK